MIDGLVRDIGSLATDVHTAEHTLATDPRTRAARVALDEATDAVCGAIDHPSHAAEKRAATAVGQARAIIAQLGVTVRDGRNLVSAAQKLIDRAQHNAERAADLRGPRPPRRR